MPLNYTELTLNNFAGGITDKYINSDPTKLKTARNFLITENYSLKSRPGFELFFEQDALVRIMGLYDLNDDLLVFRGQQLYYHEPVGGTLDLLSLPAPAAPFFQYTGVDSYVSGLNWRDQVLLTNTGQKSPEQLNRPMKAFRDDTNTLRGLELGLRKFVEGSMIVNFTGSTGTSVSYNSPSLPEQTEAYVWAFHYSYEYKVGSVTYQMDGPVYYSGNYFSTHKVGLIPVEPPVPADEDKRINASFSNIPQIDPSNSQIDATNTTIKFYRTVSGGTNFFLVSEVPFGTLSINDSTTDEDLINNEPLYTNGGVLDYYPAPKCKFMTIVNDTPYFAYVVDEDSNEIKPYRVIQGTAGSPDTCHPSAYKEFDDEITGISNVNGFPIVFTKSYIYRLEGTYDNTGGGNIRARVISEKVGCVSNNSIVRTNNRLYFIGNNGVYVTDGYNVEQVPASLTLFETIQTFIDNEDRREKITATYDYIEERIYWSVADNDTENNWWLILNLKSGGFTTADGNSFFSSATVFKDKSIIRGDDKGYLFEHKEGYYNDIVRDHSVAASEWRTNHIPFEFETVSLDFGSPAITKWVASLNTSVKSDTNYAILPVSNNDDERVVKDMKFIRSWGTFYWGDPTFAWGDPEIKWKKQETEDHKRHFPRGTMRCKRKQVRMTPADVPVYRSDIYGLADAVYVNPAEPLDFTVTLQSGEPWPENAPGYSIVFEESGYVTKHEILSRLGNTITIAGGDLLPGTDKKWEIVGPYKDQEIEIKSVTVRYAPLANEGGEYRTTESGANV